jgi:hypothetical protein
MRRLDEMICMATGSLRAVSAGCQGYMLPLGGEPPYVVAPGQ